MILQHLEHAEEAKEGLRAEINRKDELIERYKIKNKELKKEVKLKRKFIFVV